MLFRSHQHTGNLGYERRLAAASHSEITDTDHGGRQTAPEIGPALEVPPARPDELAVEELKQCQCTTRNGRTTPMDPPLAGRS